MSDLAKRLGKLKPRKKIRAEATEIKVLSTQPTRIFDPALDFFVNFISLHGRLNR
jgi:hypothetical protein